MKLVVRSGCSPATASTTNDAVEPGYGGSGDSDTLLMLPLLLMSGQGFQVKAALELCSSPNRASSAAKRPSPISYLATQVSAVRSLSINLEFWSLLSLEPRRGAPDLIVTQLASLDQPLAPPETLRVQAVPRSRFERSLLLRVAPGCHL